MYGYLVGAENRWEYLVAGDPLRQIGEAEPEAKQGEVRGLGLGVWGRGEGMAWAYVGSRPSYHSLYRRWGRVSAAKTTKYQGEPNRRKYGVTRQNDG